MPIVDPPWRLDPLQMIVRVRWGPTNKKYKGTPEDPNDPEGPGGCFGIIVHFFPVETCYCPGIFCVSQASFPGHKIIGMKARPSVEVCPTGGGLSCCASGQWVQGFYVSQPDPLTGCAGVNRDDLPPGTIFF